MSRQEGYITDQELNSDLKKKIDDSNTNSILVKQQIGDLSSLKTANKTTLVTAINEVKDGISTVVNNTLGSVELSTNDKTVKGAINEVKNSISTVVDNTLGSATLVTNDKTIKGAINEAFQYANDGKSTIASVIGSPTDSNNTFNQIRDNIQGCKNTLTANLNTKGIGATSNESLLTLVSKVANITTESLGGRRIEVVKEIKHPTGKTYNEPNVYNETCSLPTNAVILIYSFYTYKRHVGTGTVSIFKHYNVLINGKSLGIGMNIRGSSAGSSGVELSEEPIQMHSSTTLYCWRDEPADYEYIAIY